MATRPHERLILRVVGGPPSILHRRNNVQWTEDGDDLPHFSLRVLLNRPTAWLNARQAFLRPHAGIVAEASYFAGYCRGARKLFVYATDRPRGDRSTECDGCDGSLHLFLYGPSPLWQSPLRHSASFLHDSPFFFPAWKSIGAA